MVSFKDRIKADNIRIVCSIDDENAPDQISSIDQLPSLIIEAELEKLNALLDNIPELKLLSDILESKDLDASQRIDSINEKVNLIFTENEWGQEKISEIFSLVAKSKVGNTASKLKQVFKSKDVIFKIFSFSEWNLSGPQLLASASPESRVLLLIDETNDLEPEALSDGKAILKNLAKLQSAQVQNIDCILVTSKCGRDEELVESHNVYSAVREELRAESLTQPARKIFVLAKDRMSDANSTLQKDFEIHLDRIKAAKYSKLLADASRNVLKAAVDDAMEWIIDMPLPEFHGSVFVSSAIEGTSEAETLLRLVSLKQGEALERVMATNKEITDPIEKLRKIPQKHVMNSAAPQALRELRKLEFERDGNHINQLLLPIACGDVFEVGYCDPASHEDKKVEVILLGNPCDLVLRKNGSRVSTFGLVAEILRVSSKEEAAKVSGTLAYSIKTGADVGAVQYVIKMNKLSSVPMLALDVVWTNREGLARFSLAKCTEIFPHLAPAQQSYLVKLKKGGQLRLPEFNMFGTRFSPAISSEGVGSDAESYQIRRVWRLTRAYASAALSAFSQSLSRPAFGHDFLRFE